jgi:hypothetical protein
VAWGNFRLVSKSLKLLTGTVLARRLVREMEVISQPYDIIM